MIKVKISESILTGMIQKAITKVLNEENDNLIGIDELIRLADKAGKIAIGAQEALMSLSTKFHPWVGPYHNEAGASRNKVESILAKYGLSIEELNTNGTEEMHEQGSNLGQLSQEDVDKFFYNFLDPKLHAGFNSNESGLGELNGKERRDEVLYAMKELGISNIGDLWKEFQSIEAKTGGATGYQESKKTTTDKTNINEYSNDRIFLETYIDGQQMLGSDGTTVMSTTHPRAIDNAVKIRINTIKGLITNVKPYIGKAKNITLKLVNGNNKILKEFDVTNQVLGGLGAVAESKNPTIIKVKFSELRNVITQMIKEEAGADFFDNKDGDAENNFEEPFNENDPQINEGEAWASDGGYYTKPERDIVISKKDAEFINSIIEKLKKDIVSPDGIILVNNTSVGQINLQIIKDLIKNVGVKFQHDGEGEHDYYWLAPDQDIQNIMAELELADQLFYDRIEDNTDGLSEEISSMPINNLVGFNFNFGDKYARITSEARSLDDIWKFNSKWNYNKEGQEKGIYHTKSSKEFGNDGIIIANDIDDAKIMLNDFKKNGENSSYFHKEDYGKDKFQDYDKYGVDPTNWGATSDDLEEDINTSNEHYEETEPFIVHGVYTVSNSGGYEIMLNDSGDAAKVRDAYGSDNPETSDWLEIEYVPEENTSELEPVIDPNGYNIPLNQVMRANK